MQATPPEGMRDVHHLAPIIHDALPWLSFPTRAVVDALLLSGGSIGTADLVAERLGLRNRFCLARSLQQDGLPPLHRLSGYVTVLQWVWQWERDRVPLCRSALDAGKEPAAAYRLVQRITSVSWTEVRAEGLSRALSELLKECTKPGSRPTASSQQKRSPKPASPRPPPRPPAPGPLPPRRAPVTRNCTPCA